MSFDMLCGRQCHEGLALLACQPHALENAILIGDAPAPEIAILTGDPPDLEIA